MLKEIVKSINNYFETILNRISLRQLLITLLLVFVSIVLSVFTISTYKTMYKTIYQERIEKLKYVADFAIKILEYENSLVQTQQKTLKQAQEDAIGIIKNERFEDNDYIWIQSYKGVMIYHPYKELVGTNVINSIDYNNYKFGLKMVETAQKYGSGYVHYQWPKINKDKSKSYQKVSYVVEFKNWNWVIGTGLYIDDVNTKIVNSMIKGILPVLFVLLLLIIVFRYIILTSMVKPLDELADKSIKLARNDLTVTLPKKSGNTELGKLYTAFNIFVEFFKEKRDNEKKLSLIHDSIADVLITLDDEGNIQSSNPTIEKVFGYEQDEIIGKNIDILTSPALFDYNKTKASSGKLTLGKFELLGIKKTKEIFNIEISINEFLHNDEKMFILLITDITERKRVEKMKNEFVSTVSHELRTPLTSLRGSLGLITSGKMGALSETIKELLEIANSNCSRLINLINDILDIEKIEAGKIDFNLKTVELMSLLNQAIQLNVPFAKKFNVKINLIKTVDNIFVQVDSSRLIQVITNLLSNAIKFSESGSSVDVSVIDIDKNIRVSITNYGEKIPNEFKSRIFQKFAQADSSDSRQKGGTGLGLNISKAIIDELNGSINFVSENNVTTFTFELPVVPENTGE